jgi:hypothetical protein
MLVIDKEPNTGLPAYELMMGRVRNAWRWRRNHWNGDDQWARAYKMFRGDHWQYRDDDWDLSSDAPRDRVTVNVVGSTILNMVPFLMRRSPYFYVNPKKEESILSAKLQENSLNYEWRNQKMQKQVKAAVLDSSIIGHGIIKTGFTFKAALPDNPAKDGNIVFDDSMVKDESPWVKRVSPFLFLFDPLAIGRDLQTARWCAEIYYDSVSNVLANPLYSKKAKNKILDGLANIKTIDDILREGEGSIYNRFGDADKEGVENQQIVLFEVWDKKFMKQYVFADGCTEPLLERPWPYDYLGGFPYIKFDFIPIPDEHYGIGIPKWCEDPQLELNRIRTFQFDHIRRNNPKYIGLEGVMEDSEERKFEYGDPSSLIKVKDMNGIKPLELANIPQDKYQIAEVIKQDIREMSGGDELLRGGALADRTSATEVNARTNLLNLKLDERVELVDRFVEEIGSQVLKHIKNGYTTKKVARINGPQGQFWIPYTKEDIQDEVDIEIQSTSKPRLEPQQRISNVITIMQTMAQIYPLMMQQGAIINWGEFARKLLGELDWKDAASIFPYTAEIQQPVVPQPAQQGGAGSPSAPPPVAQAPQAESQPAEFGAVLG